NLIATLMFSQGVRMILGGDEIGRTQGGNNNAYCQDNEIGWYGWDLDADDRELLAFTRDVSRIFREEPVLRRRSFFNGAPVAGREKDVTWVRPDGEEMTDGDWQDPQNRVLGMLMPGRATDETDPRGRPIHGRTLLLLLNAGSRSRSYTLPKQARPGSWRELVNTARPRQARTIRRPAVNLVAHSLALFAYEEGAGTSA
ncbi:MAG TPA: glycogen debranching enzyme GlgX, partial [Actinomycetota bacterium]|nr:glycogen debranching enzyme GlgX [Actinomycetota bacterium]